MARKLLHDDVITVAIQVCALVNALDSTCKHYAPLTRFIDYGDV